MARSKTAERTIVHSMEEVPLFATEDEERQWWATHDLAPELWEDVTEEQGVLLDRLAAETGAQEARRRKALC